MKTVPLRALTLAGLIAAIIVTTGCEKAAQVSAPEPRVTPAPITSAAATAEQTSFSEVGKHLDTGGSFYFYLSSERALAKLHARAGELQQALLASIPPDEVEKKAKAELIATVLLGLIRESGIESLTGFGASSIAIDSDLYLNKFFLHHSAGKGNGFLWNIFGQSPHDLDALDLLPEKTAIAGFADIDLHGLFLFIQQMALNSGRTEATQVIARVSSTVKILTGMTLDELTASTGNQWGMILMLDPEKTVSIPIDGQSQSLPEPRAAILLRVADEKIFDRVDQISALNPKIERVDEEGLKMRIMPLRGFPALDFRVTLAQWNNWLIIASHESVVREIVDAKGGGLRATAQFKRLSEGLPTEGNGFTVATEKFADAVEKFQKSSIRNNESVVPGQTKLMETLLEWQKPATGYSVASRLNDGMLMVNKGTAGASHFLAPLVATPVAIGAKAAARIITEVQEKAKATKSLANARQIAIACSRYAADHEGAFPKDLKELVGPYIADGLILISPFKDDEAGYAYTPELTASSPADTVLLKDKFSPDAGFEITVTLDGSGKIEESGP